MALILAAPWWRLSHCLQMRLLGYITPDSTLSLYEPNSFIHGCSDILSTTNLYCYWREFLVTIRFCVTFETVKAYCTPSTCYLLVRANSASDNAENINSNTLHSTISNYPRKGWYRCGKRYRCIIYFQAANHSVLVVIYGSFWFLMSIYGSQVSATIIPEW